MWIRPVDDNREERTQHHDNHIKPSFIWENTFITFVLFLDLREREKHGFVILLIYAFID